MLSRHRHELALTWVCFLRIHASRPGWLLAAAGHGRLHPDHCRVEQLLTAAAAPESPPTGQPPGI